MDTLQIVAIKGLAAGPVNLLLGLWAGAALPNLVSALSAAVVGFLCYGVSLVFYILALRDLGTARTAAYFSVAPFFGAAVAVIVYSEPVTAQLMIAGALRHSASGCTRRNGTSTSMSMSAKCIPIRTFTTKSTNTVMARMTQAASRIPICTFMSS